MSAPTYTREIAGKFHVRVEAGFYSPDELRAMATLADEQRSKVNEALSRSMVQTSTPETVPAPEASFVERFKRSPRHIPTPTCSVCGEPGCPDHM